MSLIKSVNVLLDPDNSGYVITWSLNSEIESGGYFFVQKSTDGVRNFTNINNEPIPDTQFEYKDNSNIKKTLNDSLYYRVLYADNFGKRHVSQTIQPFYRLRPREYAVARHIMRLEKTSMSKSIGITLELLKKKQTGEICKCSTAETGQSIGASICDICYGTKIVGGYEKPIPISAVILNNQNSVNTNETGLGYTEQNMVGIKTLAYPRIWRDDLIINRQKQELYIVGNVQYKDFKGVLPIIANIELQKLYSNDVRYKLLK